MKLNKKIVWTNQFPLTEKVETEKLAKLAEQGWILKSVVLGEFYLLEKGAPEQVVYTFDRFQGQKSELPDYLELFQAGNWDLVCKVKIPLMGTYHIFKAPQGTTPVYTDEVTLKENYAAQKVFYLRQSLFLFLLSLLIFAVSIPYSLTLLGINVIQSLAFLILSFAFVCLFLAGAFWKKQRKGSQANETEISQWVIVLSMILGMIFGATFAILTFV